MLEQNSVYLSIIIPAYNEEANIAATLKDIAAFLKGKSYTHQVIVVDDGSTDQTYALAQSLSRLFSSFVILKNPTNRGKGYSVKRGVLSARGELVLFMDADNATRIDQLGGLIKAIDDGYDIAVGSRRVPGAKVKVSQPLYRIILGNVYIILSSIILGTKIKDYNCGFKLFKKDAAKLLFSRLQSEDWSFDSELIFLISRLKLKIKEAAVVWENKKTSKVRPIRDGIKSFLSLLRIRFLGRLT
jgi:dolichyl-phosphate beta-glucosyltransferase